MKITNDMIDKQLRLRGNVMNMIFKASDIKSYIKLSKRFNKINKLSKSFLKDINLEKKWIYSKERNKEICIYIYSLNNKKKQKVPGVLWLHGGGYSMGSASQDEDIYRKLIKEEECIIIAPEYTLSTTKPYPEALLDCYDSLLWMKKNVEELGIRENQIIVGGQSAGGGLVAALTLYARDKKEVKIAFQMPLYPMIDDRMITESSKDNNAPVWNSKLNKYAWELYLGDLYKKDVPIYAAPAREENLLGIPPTITFVGDLEPFRDETIKYVENLKKSGIHVDFKIFKGCYHAFNITNPKAQVSKLANEFLLKGFKYAVNNYFVK
ncbi:MAG: alpha/beta hydrolase [Sarcina sp.]